MLLLEADRFVSAERLADLLWDGDPPADARRMVQVSVSRLRGRLTTVGSSQHDVHLVTQGSAYALKIAPDRVDVHRFRHLVDEARFGADPHAGVARLREALGLWRGPALADVASGGLRQRVAVPLEEERLVAFEDLMDLELAAHRHQVIVAELTGMVAENPLRERLHGQLMLALHRTGRQAEALETYQDLRRRLRDAFALDPGEAIQRLHQRILAADPALDAGPDQVRVPEVGRSPAPAGPVPRQLPTDVSGFVGRGEQLTAMDRLLRDASSGPVAVAAIVGTAGVGKTSLAIRWAHAVAGRFPDGQLYANLRGFDPAGLPVPADEVLRAFLLALGVAPARLPASAEDVVRLYRSVTAPRRLLFVLDNARDAAQVRPLLPGGPGCLVLVTSRDHLTGLVATDGAQPIALDIMTASEAYELLVRRLGPARVAAEPEAVDDIIIRTARLPLALAITAARAAVRPEFSLAGLAKELRDTQMDALGGADPATDMRTVFSYSYHALSVGSAALFRRLGLHLGPDFAGPAAASLAGLPVAQVRPLLAELSEANLISEQRTGRYVFHDLLRAYAAELANLLDPPADRQATLQRLVDHYVHTADAANRQLGREKHLSVQPPPPDPTTTIVEPGDIHQALAWFDAELANLAAVAAHVVAAGADTQTLALAAILDAYLDRRGHWQFWASTQEAAVRAAQRRGDPILEADALACLAGAQASLGDFDEAVRNYHRAIELYPDDNLIKLGEAMLGLSGLLANMGRLDESLPEGVRALELFRAAGNRNREAAALNDIGYHYELIGEHRQALAHCELALALFEEAGNRTGQAFTLDSLGQAHHHLGHEELASDCHQRALDLLREVGARYPEATILIHIGDAHHAGGRLAQAAEAWRQALQILEELDHPDAEEVRAKLG